MQKSKLSGMLAKEQEICHWQNTNWSIFMISDKRAQSVANIFIKKYNFPSNSLITEAVSDTKPLFKENMPAGTQANQRTEIFLNILVCVKK